MEITFCGVPVRFEPIDGPRDVVTVLKDLPEDLNGEWSTPPWTQDVMTAKLMIELAGLDAHDLDAVEVYSRSQHDFVLSCLVLSMSEKRRAEADRLPGVLGFGRVDLFFDELMRNCHATTGVYCAGEDPAAVGSTQARTSTVHTAAWRTRCHVIMMASWVMVQRTGGGRLALARSPCSSACCWCVRCMGRAGSAVATVCMTRISCRAGWAAVCRCR